MDYLEIVFKGFADNNSREYLSNYFFREFKKAENEHFEAEEFFNGCFKVIEALETEMDRRLYKRKHELYLMLDRAENGESNFAEADETKTFEQRCKELIGYCENELATISRYNFPVNLLHFTSNRFIGQFQESDALEIREAISKAKDKVTNVIPTAPIRIYYSIPLGNIVNGFGNDEKGKREYANFVQGLNDHSFQTEIKTLSPEKISERLEFHLRCFKRNGGEQSDWINHTKVLLPANISPEQKDAFLLWLEINENSLKSEKAETKKEQEIIEMKPVLKPEAVQIVFDIIKDFFGPEQQTELKQVIGTGNKASEKMLFKANGNRLTDTFKKLIEHDFITGCQKQDLINWIISNFTFTHQNNVKAFIYDTVEKTISRNDNPCKSPLIKIESGQIQKVEQPRIKKYNRY